MRYNNGYHINAFLYLLYLSQAIPLKRKDDNTVHNALKKFLNSSYFNNLKRLNTDEGREFYKKKKKSKKKKKLSHSKDILYSVSSKEIKTP